MMLQQHEKDLKWLLGQAHSPPFVLAQLSGTKVELKLFKAEYLGSGTFVISKPKRKKIKVRQSALKNPRRGSRK